MLAFFASGLNEKFIPNNTALDKVNTAGYEKLHTTKEEINRLEEIMTEADKVYYLCQYPADDLSGRSCTMRLYFIIWMEESAIICNRHGSLQIPAAIFVWKSLICRSQIFRHYWRRGDIRMSGFTQRIHT